MTSTTARLGLIKPNDVVGIEDDIVDVTAQISDSYDKLDGAVGVIHVANFAALPSTGNFYGRIAQTDDTGEQWEYNSGWKFSRDTQWQTTWKPNITAQTGTVVLGSGGDRKARYFRIGNRCRYAGFIYTGGAGFNGGSGSFSMSIPYTSLNLNAVVAEGSGSVNTHGEDFACYSRIDGGQGVVKLFADYYDTSASAIHRVRSIQIQNCDNGGAATGTGIPRYDSPSQYTWDAAFPGYMYWDIEYPFDINAPIATTP